MVEAIGDGVAEEIAARLGTLVEFELQAAAATHGLSRPAGRPPSTRTGRRPLASSVHVRHHRHHLWGGGGADREAGPRR